MTKYVKKPIVIEAYHLKDLSYKSVKECLKFMGQSVKVPRTPSIENPFDKYMRIIWEQNGITINTLNGNHMVTPGDYIIKGIKGEFYPCKIDIFEETYERVYDNEK